jgi:wyosine [tRNA(Phe)-imidazoG37] synthetase (radical SAM superfamily)
MVSGVEAAAFGPVPSRRLGRSLGINNIPPKNCTYSCVYCQLGRTSSTRAQRGVFYDPAEIVKAVKRKVEEVRERGESMDFLAFVPDGEPTLDVNLGEEIDSLKQLGIKIGVISNASLISRSDVQNDLLRADWVSLKVDAVTEYTWRRINRPNRSLKFYKVLESIAEFSRKTAKELVTETMLVYGVNDTTSEIERIADFLAGIEATRCYISIPTRPPAERWVRQPVEAVLNTAYQVFRERSLDVEYLIGYEGNAFTYTGDAQDDLLKITSVHPMREDAVTEFLARAGTDWSLVERLIADGEMIDIVYGSKNYYMRRLPDSRRRNDAGSDSGAEPRDGSSSGPGR